MYFRATYTGGSIDSDPVTVNVACAAPTKVATSDKSYTVPGTPAGSLTTVIATAATHIVAVSQVSVCPLTFSLRDSSGVYGGTFLTWADPALKVDTNVLGS